jgi:hypothetical protein
MGKQSTSIHKQERPNFDPDAMPHRDLLKSGPPPKQLKMKPLRMKASPFQALACKPSKRKLDTESPDSPSASSFDESQQDDTPLLLDTDGLIKIVQHHFSNGESPAPSPTESQDASVDDDSHYVEDETDSQDDTGPGKVDHLYYRTGTGRWRPSRIVGQKMGRPGDKRGTSSGAFKPRKNIKRESTAPSEAVSDRRFPAPSHHELIQDTSKETEKKHSQVQEVCEHQGGPRGLAQVALTMTSSEDRVDINNDGADTLRASQLPPQKIMTKPGATVETSKHSKHTALNTDDYLGITAESGVHVMMSIRDMAKNFNTNVPYIYQIMQHNTDETPQAASDQIVEFAGKISCFCLLSKSS